MLHLPTTGGKPRMTARVRINRYALQLNTLQKTRKVERLPINRLIDEYTSRTFREKPRDVTAN